MGVGNRGNWGWAGLEIWVRWVKKGYETVGERVWLMGYWDIGILVGGQS